MDTHARTDGHTCGHTDTRAQTHTRSHSRTRAHTHTCSHAHVLTRTARHGRHVAVPPRVAAHCPTAPCSALLPPRYIPLRCAATRVNAVAPRGPSLAAVGRRGETHGALTSERGARQRRAGGCGRHEQSAPARAEKVHGQEAVVEAERRPARPGHPAGLRPLHEPGHRRVRGDGTGRAAEQHRHGGDPREQHHHAGSFGTSIKPWRTSNPNPPVPFPRPRRRPQVYNYFVVN